MQFAELEVDTTPLVFETNKQMREENAVKPILSGTKTQFFAHFPGNKHALMPLSVAYVCRTLKIPAPYY